MSSQPTLGPGTRMFFASIQFLSFQFAIEELERDTLALHCRVIREVKSRGRLGALS
jgi:hypothetical protein